MKKSNIIKKLITSLAAVVALGIGAAQAQQYSADAVTTGTNVIAASGTLTPGTVIAVTKNANVALSVSFLLSGTGTGNIVATFAKGVDSTTFESTPSVTVTVAASGTTTVTGVSNVSMAGVGFLKLVSVSNANTPSTVASLSIKAAKKPGN